MRRVWIQIHLWLGLTLGAVGIFIGITGSILIYDHEVDALLHPQRYAVSGSQVSLTYDQYAALVIRALDGRARIANIRLPKDDGLPIVVLARGLESGEFYRVHVDPPTGRVLQAVRGGGLIGWVHRFHENLILREYRGREFVGLVGFAMLISSLSGIYLWWPASARFREALSFRAGCTRSRNFHYLAGFYGSLALALLSFTGIWLSYPDGGRAVVSVFSTLSALPRSIQGSSELSVKPIGTQTAVNLAQELYPNAKVAAVALPAGPRGVYRVTLSDKSGAATVVLIDALSGTVLWRFDPSTQSAGDRFLAAQRRIHTGEAFGAAGRVVFFAAGLLPAFLVVTGTMIWLRRRRRPEPSASATTLPVDA